MGLVIAGIDEAGYGPLLGPMCVGMSVFRVDDFDQPNPSQTPCLWDLLSPQVSRSAAVKSRGPTPPLAIADSKQLKLANSSVRSHPLTHLERGVLTMLRCGVDSPALPADDNELFQRLGAALHNAHDCYGGPPIPLPLSGSALQLNIAANLVTAALARARVNVLALRCVTIPEPEFNRIAKAENSKAAVTIAALGTLLGELWRSQVGGPDTVHLVCDRLGGRTSYGEMLAKLMREIEPGGMIRVLGQTERRSRYAIEHKRGSMQVSFEVESESANLPVALASMIAKLVRELAMLRFNRYFSARRASTASTIELQPTAGYRNDGRRWLQDAADIITDTDRRTLIREF